MLLNSGVRRGFPLCLWQLPYIPLITSVIFQSPSPGDSCHNSSLSPNSHPSPPLPPGLPSPLRGLFSPSPSPTHRASPHLCPPPSTHATSEDPLKRPCLLPVFCRTPVSCPHAGSVTMSLWGLNWKICSGSRENPDPDQESRAVPMGMEGKGEGIWEEDLVSESCRGERVFFMCPNEDEVKWHLISAYAYMPSVCQVIWVLSARLLCPWHSPGKNTGMGCHFLLQGIFPIQGSNPRFLHLLHWQVSSLPLSCLDSPQICWELI